MTVMTAVHGSAVTLQDQVAEEVRVQLARARMTQRQLALRLGWGQMYLSRRASGRLPFTIADLELIADALEIPVTRLLPRSEDGFITCRKSTRLRAA